MFNENLATLKSPDRQAKCMRIQFEIKEKLPDIISEILHSDKWLTLVRDENHGLRRVTIKDPYFDSEACVDIWEHEIHVTTAWSNYTYRIYQKGNSVWCEYIGAYRGLLEQNLLPTMTPKENILDSEVLNSSLFGDRKETLRNYSAENLKLKNFRRDNFAAEYQLAFLKPIIRVWYMMSLLKKGFQFPLLKIEKKSPVINTGLFLFEDHRMIPESSSLFQSFLLASLNLRPKSKFQEKVSINIRLKSFAYMFVWLGA